MTDHPFKPQQSVKVLDAYHKYWTTGKVVFTRDSGAAIDTAQGVRIWASYDRIKDRLDEVPRMTIQGDLFAPCVPC